MKKTLLLKRNLLFFSFLSLLTTGTAQYEIGLSVNQDFGPSHLISRYTTDVQNTNLGATSVRMEYNNYFWKSRFSIHASLSQSFISAKGSYYETGPGRWTAQGYHESKEDFDNSNSIYGRGGDSIFTFSDHMNKLNVLIGVPFLKRFEFSAGISLRTIYSNSKISYLFYERINNDTSYYIRETPTTETKRFSSGTGAMYALRISGILLENEKNKLKLEYTFRCADKYVSHNVGLTYVWKKEALIKKKTTL